MEYVRGFIHKFTQRDASLANVEPEQAVNRAAQLGAEYLKIASNEYPAFDRAQSAYIALKLKHSLDVPYTPLQLGQALLKDQEELAGVITAGDARHGFAGNGPVDEEDNLIPLDLTMVKNVVVLDFLWAQEMLDLEDSQLEHIMRLYHEYMDLIKQGMNKAEARLNFRYEVNEMVREHIGDEAYEVLKEQIDAALQKNRIITSPMV